MDALSKHVLVTFPFLSAPPSLLFKSPNVVRRHGPWCVSTWFSHSRLSLPTLVAANIDFGQHSQILRFWPFVRNFCIRYCTKAHVPPALSPLVLVMVQPWPSPKIDNLVLPTTGDLLSAHLVDGVWFGVCPLQACGLGRRIYFHPRFFWCNACPRGDIQWFLFSSLTSTSLLQTTIANGPHQWG